jgi:hypothetical protein
MCLTTTILGRGDREKGNLAPQNNLVDVSVTSNIFAHTPRCLVLGFVPFLVNRIRAADTH